MTETMRFDKLVIIGASAGGIDALSNLVSKFPADFPSPIVLAQHLDPDRPSHLPEILARRSSLPVREVKDQEPLESGVIFVVPQNHHVEINDHAVTVIPDSGGRPLPSIDLLLTTAAATFQEGLIAVILTGMGLDGAAGARDVKASGGTVIIQNPATAAFPGMLLALAPNVVDIVADLENVGQLLFDLLTGRYAVPPVAEDAGLQAILAELREQSGIDFASYKLPTIARRLRHRMVATGSTDVDAYRRYLAYHPDEHQKLVNSFLIKVTEFFRDPELYDYLRVQVLPQILAEASRHNELRIWSAGCATGEEAYSLAILLADSLNENLDHRIRVRIFATDADGDAIAFARRGVYPASTMTQLPAETIDRHFTRLDGAYEVNKQIRAMVVFGQHDLGQRSPFPRIDLAFCRNVLIYFTPELQKRALQLFAFSLREGGFLVLGKSETVTPLGEAFALEHPRLRVYRRVGNQVLIPSARIRSATPSLAVNPNLTRPSLAGQGQVLARFSRSEQAVARSVGDKAEKILQGLPAGIVIVDRRYDIQTINAAARNLLGIHTSAVGEDLIHLLRGQSLLALRSAIDEALLEQSPAVVYPLASPEVETGETRYLEITCFPQPLRGGDGPPDSVLIQILDVTRPFTETRRLEQELTRQREQQERQAEQIRSLSASNIELLAANRELAETNAMLRGTNEEMQVTYEEIQAAAEEVETLNEEMQATNEELETLNEELQATVEELNTTNEDLEARSLEMHDLAVSLEAQRQASETERARLDAVLRSIADGVLVVDRLSHTVLANAAYERLFGSTETDPPLEREPGQPLPPDATPRRRAARGETFSEEITYLASDGTRRWIEAKGTPIRAEEGQERGVVVIRDITERSLRRLQDQFLAIASHELRTPLTALQGALQLLERQLRPLPDGERLHKHAGQAMRQVQRMGTHINELMDVARLRSGQLTLKRERLDLVVLATRAVETARLINPTKPVELTAPVEPIWVEVDAGRVEQVLLNLIGNAFVHAPSSERIDVRLTARGDNAEIQVQDYGEGIPPQHIKNIFSRFSSLDQEMRGRSGLGLGLFIACEIATSHGGTIDVASTPGEGTTFTVCLPLGSAPGAD